ncbi:hypothetical protein Ddc_07914 [Ditylenchus destructor]|nr:hypothetical protein Ddc_07914 [Ditylenchus destructor]
MKRRYNSIERFAAMDLAQNADNDPANTSRRKSHENLLPPTSIMRAPQNPTPAPYYAQPNIAQYHPTTINIPPRQTLLHPASATSAPASPSQFPNDVQWQNYKPRISPFPQNSNYQRPLAGSVASTARTPKSYDRLADVYSSSNDSFQFAEHLRQFFDANVPGFVWVIFCIAQIVFGLVSIFVGTFNYPLCHIEPKIPLYLILSGLALIINGSVRICVQIPTPGSNTQKQSSLGVRNFCSYALEGSVLFAIVICVILGCVWVYGAKYVQFERYRFERNYCDYFLYW